jgi:acetyl/propionyl-CoA carboxylase alpha subunit
MRTARVMGMQTVAVYSDADAGALHVREATARLRWAVSSADSYLRIDKLIAAARSQRRGCGASGLWFPQRERGVRAGGDGCRPDLW